MEEEEGRGDPNNATGGKTARQRGRAEKKKPRTETDVSAVEKTMATEREPMSSIGCKRKRSLDQIRVYWSLLHNCESIAWPSFSASRRNAQRSDHCPMKRPVTSSPGTAAKMTKHKGGSFVRYSDDEANGGETTDTKPAFFRAGNNCVLANFNAAILAACRATSF